MKNKTFISVVIPVHNESSNVKELIDSLSETLKTFSHELIFIDDHSTDITYSLIKRFGHKKNVAVYKNENRSGKSYALMLGFSKAKGDYMVMIDGDLQYPTDVIPEMIKKLSTVDIVVANREKYEAGSMRKFMSSTFRNIFGKYLFKLPFDVQSGLKVFKKKVIDSCSFTPSSPWTFDLEFLHRAKEAGFSIANYPITFATRKRGVSKISFIRNSFEIAHRAILLRKKRLGPVTLFGKNHNSAINAGIGFRKKQYIIHTYLPHHLLALETFTLRQKCIVAFLLGAIITGFIISPLFIAQLIVGILSLIYFIDALFHLFILVRSVKKDTAIVITQNDLETISDKELPVYTILCPLYKEAHVIPQFLQAISKIEWPKSKLEVLLLLEEDDWESVDAVKKMKLPAYVTAVVVPDSQPKTKPKACNYGLQIATGSYLVIYDAEDKPDPLQLKKAYYTFQKLPRKVVCLQAKLNYYNPEQNLLTRFFTAEYSLWFDVTLPGLQSLKSTIPLGGTSNHFRTEDLRTLLGWDPFNVTEDADLGVRLFKKGYQTAIIDSTTYEEANSNVRNWLRQRSRWIKGYMQTYLVHLRRSIRFPEQNITHALIFHLTVGGKIAFILINPFLWLITILYFTAYALVGPTLETLYVAPIFYLAVISLVFGNFMYLYFYMIGCAKRGQWSLIKYIYFIPFYWLLLSIAGGIAFYQLIFKPHYWEKNSPRSPFGSSTCKA